MEAESLDRAWDPSAPGAGALRATAIAQLYFRMTSHHPLTILIVDALCLTFGPDGATVPELVDYLGITEDRVRFGLDGIPAEMRCTAQQLESEGILFSGGASPVGGPDSAALGQRRDDVEMRYFLNYKRLLPLVYAHVLRLLLSACVVDLPPCRYVDSVKAAQRAFYKKSSSSSTAHAFLSSTASDAPPTTAIDDVGGDHVDVSDAMKRQSAIRGVYCLGCSRYFLVEEFNDTLSRCPLCAKDTLRLCIRHLQRQMNQRIAEQHTAVKLLPGVSQVWKHTVAALAATLPPATHGVTQSPTLDVDLSNKEIPETAPSADGSAKQQQRRSQPAAPTSNSAPPPSPPEQQQLLDCALAQDPFLLQQALAFLFLYSTRFASVNDAASVVDVQEILTEPEYRERLRGKASLADQFRSRHRHAASVHVRLLSQREVDAARQEESHRKLLKRAMLPPWLRHTTSLEALGGSHAYGRTRNETAAKTSGGVAGEGAQESWESAEVTAGGPVGKHVETGGAVWTPTGARGSPVAQKRQRQTPAEVKAELTRTAEFIACNFYEDDYDEVALPLARSKRRL